MNGLSGACAQGRIRWTLLYSVNPSASNVSEMKAKTPLVLRTGKGVPRDTADARWLFERACQTGCATGCNNLIMLNDHE